MKKAGIKVPSAAITTLSLPNSDTESLCDLADPGNNTKSSLSAGVTGTVDCLGEDRRWVRIVPVILLLYISQSKVYMVQVSDLACVYYMYMCWIYYCSLFDDSEQVVII